MADDRNRSGQGDQGTQGGSHGAGSNRGRTIGEGMNSPDSTQMPLKASTGEPDYETQSDRNRNASGGSSGGSSSRGSSSGGGSSGG